MFVRDNENDGGDYMIRVCHSFFGADHGYPYDYYERHYQAMQPLADLGRGLHHEGQAATVQHPDTARAVERIGRPGNSRAAANEPSPPMRSVP